MCHFRPIQATSMEKRTIRSLLITMMSIAWGTDKPSADEGRLACATLVRAVPRTQVCTRSLPVCDVQTCYCPKAEEIEPTPRRTSELHRKQMLNEHTKFDALVAKESDRGCSMRLSAHADYHRPQAVCVGPAMPASVSASCCGLIVGNEAEAKG